MTIFENVKSYTTIFPVAVGAGAVNGVAIDTEGFEDGMVVVQVGATTGTPTSFTVAGKIQESADGSTGWADITGDTIATVTAANKTGEIFMPIGTRAAAARYVRAVVTPAFVGGTSPTIAIGATVLLGNETYGAVTNSRTAD